MSSAIKPITVYAHPAAPHPWKIALILRELEIPHELLFKTSPEVSKEDIKSRNPNERVPIIEDPNTGITVWESAAIALYLVETYDKEAILTYTTGPEKWQVRQWAIMSATTQDQFYGQKAYFTMFHENKNIPSVTAHYTNEVKRILGVIELHLSRTGQSYLVGKKCTFADLMFVPFNNVLSSVILYEGFDDEWKAQMPHCYEWHQRLMQREKVKEAFQARAKAEQAMYAANGGVPQR